MAFKAKDLHYEKQEPAFLRKLRGEVGGDRHNVAIARPQKPRLDRDDDDGPTIVDEGGNSLTQEEFDTLHRDVDDPATKQLQGQEQVHSVPGDDVVNAEEMQKDRQQKVVEVGGPTKRKAVRIVADDVEEVAQQGISEAPRAKPKTRKAKKIKLSFDEEG